MRWRRPSASARGESRSALRRSRRRAGPRAAGAARVGGAGASGGQLDRRGGPGGEGAGEEKGSGRGTRRPSDVGGRVAPATWRPRRVGGRPLARPCRHGGARVGLPTQAGDCSSRKEGSSDSCLLRVTGAEHTDSRHGRT